MPTGGVLPTKDNLEDWFKAGVTCVGMGSKLIAMDSEGNYNFAKIESDTRNALAIIKELKA